MGGQPGVDQRNGTRDPGVRTWLRVGGRGRLADGGIVVWSVAEGVRGRRWRWVVDDVGVVRHAGLLELDLDGRFTRLELSGSAGLLTLHPEGDGSIHGNVVNDRGVRPITLPGDDVGAITITGDAFGSSLVGQPAGEGIVIRGGWDFGVGPRVHRDALDLDVRGVPVLDQAAEWPLELDPAN